ncbi:PIN domain-containing protein [bacterium]|nr:PIN domain-containing protein [bacterium]
MNVLVDTCVWSQVLRRKEPDAALGRTLHDLIQAGRTVLIGPIRQELLSGVAKEAQFALLKERLSVFKDLPLVTRHFIKAAEFSNSCRKHGIQGSHTDFLICSVAHLEKLDVFTTDSDFTRFQKFLPIKLF